MTKSSAECYAAPTGSRLASTTSTPQLSQETSSYLDEFHLMDASLAFLTGIACLSLFTHVTCPFR